MQLSSSLWVRRLQAQLHSKLSPSVAPCLTCSCATSSMAAPIAFRFLCLGPPPRSLLWLDSSRVARRRMQEARSLSCWQCSAAPQPRRKRAVAVQRLHCSQGVSDGNEGSLFSMYGAPVQY